jgi:uncharacterized protein YhhL (DUF1145 family)
MPQSVVGALCSDSSWGQTSSAAAISIILIDMFGLITLRACYDEKTKLEKMPLFLFLIFKVLKIDSKKY